MGASRNSLDHIKTLADVETFYIDTHLKDPMSKIETLLCMVKFTNETLKETYTIEVEESENIPIFC